MPETELKELHLAACIEDLDKRLDISNLKDKKLKFIVKSAKTVFDKAEAEQKKGDEEYAYILYMRYIALVKQMKSAPDYNKEKEFANNMIGPKTPHQACDRASKLKDSLISRYKKRQIIKAEISNSFDNKLNLTKDKELESKMYSDMVTDSIDDQINNDIFADDRRISIKSFKLFSLLKDNSVRVLVLDTRSKLDFKNSHIKFPQCINVPEECIIAGFTASKLEKNLPEESVNLWSKRASMDYIILLDWSSIDVIPGKTLHLLKTILLKWDPHVVYKIHPIILEGGYEDWLLTYPQLTTDPHIIPPTHQSSFDDLLNGIEYPPLNEPSIFSENNSSVDRSSKPYPTYKRQNPSIDRSSKAAAVQTYEERAREMEKILEEQERLAGTSLKIEKQRVIAEKNWEELRQNIEEENEEEAGQLREQELLSEIMQLESAQRDMTLENQQLREQLEEYKKKEKEDRSKSLQALTNAEPSIDFPNNLNSDLEDNEKKIKRSNLEAEALAKEKKIKIIEEEKAALAKQREILQSDREKILAEAREKKKLLFKEDDEFSAIDQSPVHTNAKMILDNKINQEIPQFDRTMKPTPNIYKYSDYNQNKHRDFQPVCGNQGQGLTGLKNLGNTCYMNSIMQCLNNTSYLNKYFREGLYREHLRNKPENENNGGTNGAVAEEVAAVIQALWSGQYRFISPKDFRNVVGRYRSIFRGIEQQDSHEFLTFVMDWLHNDLQISVNQQIHADRLPPAEKAWLEYTKSKESIVLKLFYGQIKSTVKCSRCGKESVTYDSFSNLSLELPKNASRCSLGDCLDLYLSDEKIIGWNCPSCKENRDAIKKLDISKLPPVLVIQFKRFYIDPKDYMSNSYKKKQTYIDFPINNLDMSYFSLQHPQDRKNKKYNLYAVSNHYGSMESGHCTAFCKSSYYSKWFKFDDHSVTDISPSDVVSSAAYILFYTSLPDSALHQ